MQYAVDGRRQMADRRHDIECPTHAFCGLTLVSGSVFVRPFVLSLSKDGQSRPGVRGATSSPRTETARRLAAGPLNVSPQPGR